MALLTQFNRGRAFVKFGEQGGFHLPKPLANPPFIFFS
jgi:hypothetical protein